MSQYLLLGLAAIIVLGVAAQWLAWRLKLPAILVLLAFGLIAGPGSVALTGYKWLDPSIIFGDLLYPIVSLSVAIILFEGSLTLNISELRQVGGAVTNLVTIGMLITWLVASLAAVFVLQMPARLALLLGSVLSVTGPTVIGPMLRHIKPTRIVGATLKWEGIVIDPLGATLALLVFDAIRASHGIGHLAVGTIGSLVLTLIAGIAVGLAAAGILVLLLRRFWLADYLQNPVSLSLVLLAFVGADRLHDESGLLAVTTMGIALANQKITPYRHILEFKEALSILLVSSLFILMGSRLQPAQFTGLGWRVLAFVAVLIFIGRPLSVLASTLRTPLNWREKLFLSFIAPRGVVAAAVSSIFALRLTHANFGGADRLVPVTFTVIIVTVTLYGLLSPILARQLKLAEAGSSGFLIAGAHRLARLIAKELQEQGATVAVVDTNRANLSQARLEGLTTYSNSILSDELLDKIEGTGIHQLLAMTPNEEVNSLAAVHFGRTFGRSNVYQLEPEPREPKARDGSRVSHELHGRVLFARGLTYERLSARSASSTLKRTGITEAFTFADFSERSPGAVPLFLRSGTGDISVISADAPPDPLPGQIVISLMPVDGEKAAGDGVVDERKLGRS